MKPFLKNYQTFYEYNNKGNLHRTLTSVYGINFKNYKKIMLLNGLSNIKEDLKNDDYINIKNYINYFFGLENNKIFLNVEKKKRTKSYQGMRHILRLPVRGQRTHTNSKTPRINIKKEL